MTLLNTTILCALIIGPSASTIVAAVDLPEAKISLSVRDPDNNAVPYANITIGGTARGSDDAVSRGKTYGSGNYDAQIKSNGEISARIDKPGWYTSEYWKAYSYLTDQNSLWEATHGGRWLPWDPLVTVILKRVVNPTAMYARAIRIKIPYDGTEIGFDLQAGDWVAPSGTGDNADLILKVDRRIRSDRDYSGVLTLSFPNEKDGIKQFDANRHAGSVLLSPYVAPEEGYSRRKTWRQSRTPGDAGKSDNFTDDERPNQNYLLRVRTVLDEQGRVKSALYGKIYGDIHLYVGTKVPNAGIGFTYYLNPAPNDRNVEFDPKRNLFTNLKADERVTEP
jgi:hypothetical protein